MFFKHRFQGISRFAVTLLEGVCDNGPLIPIFVRGDVSGRMGGLKPFFSLDLGYAINTENTDWGAVLVNPMIGLDFGKVYAGIGYQALCWTPKHADSTSCFNMKIGYKF